MHIGFVLNSRYVAFEESALPDELSSSKARPRRSRVDGTLHLDKLNRFLNTASELFSSKARALAFKTSGRKQRSIQYISGSS